MNIKEKIINLINNDDCNYNEVYHGISLLYSLELIDLNDYHELMKRIEE